MGFPTCLVAILLRGMVFVSEKSHYMSYSLNSLKGGYIGDYIGDHYRGY